VGKESEAAIARTGQPATVLYLHSSDDLYGADIILLQIVKGLDRSRFRPIVVLPEDMRHVGLLSAELERQGIEWMHLPTAIIRRRYLRGIGPLIFLATGVRGALAIRRIARGRNVRMIHGFTLAVASAPLYSKLLGLPLVMHAHEIIQRPKALRKMLHALGVKWSSRVICVSEAVRKNILADQAAAERSVVVVRNGINTAETDALCAEESRRALDVPEGKALIGMMGRISPWKGQDVFLKAAARVAAHRKDCHFISIGGVFDKEIQHEERLRQLRKELGLEEVATLRGFMPDARRLLAAFDIFVLPSTQPDPFPTVILEAMSAGVAVIATAHGGPLEMIVDGETGLLIPPSDPDALADAIERLVSDPELRKAMGQAARERFKKRFALEPYLNRIQAIYDEVLTQSVERIPASVKSQRLY
jgi:glycosyltransferase involved in cell wall biosynthesis